ncbi:MAG: hypothetical protein K1060chlam1_00728 [Candidatus Anoxychlamydiales bacterium]|nr:hypothetical protein [Candidatus Anoxychlamydiales bacterium]
MYKLLQIVFVFIFVVIILSIPENYVIIDRLHLKGLIARNNNVNINNLLKENNYKDIEKEQFFLSIDTLLKKISFNIDDFIEEVTKKNLDLGRSNKCSQENTFVASHIQMLDDSQDSFIRFDSYLKSNKTDFPKMHSEAFQLFAFLKNSYLQDRINEQVVKFSQNEEIDSMRGLVSNRQEENDLVENLSLKYLIVKNDFINNKKLLIDNNHNYVEKEHMLFGEDTLLKNLSLNIKYFFEENLKRSPTICEIKTSIDETAVEIPNIQMFNDSQFSVMRLNNFLDPNKALLSKTLFKQPEKISLLEENRLQKKVDKQVIEPFSKREVIVKHKHILNEQRKDLIVDNLHLKDLIAKNKIIKKRKLLKENDCKTEKEHALSYVEALLKKPSLNLNDLIEDVLKRNPDLRATKRRIEANALVVPRVQILDDPQFEAMRHDSPLRSNSEFFSKMRYELSQVFPFPGKLRLKGKIAEQMLKFAQNEEITTMRELVLQTKRLYYQLYLNYAALRINKQNQDIISRFIEDTLALYKTGEEKYDEVLKAQVELQLLKKELLNLLSDHDFIVSMINAILDYPQDNIIGKPQEFFTKNANYKQKELVPIAMRNRSELKGIKSLISEQCFKAKLARKNYFPDFKVLGRYESKLGSKDAAWGAAVSINIPLWIQQKQKREMREAMTNARAFQNDLEAFEAKIRGRIRALLSRIESTDEKIDLYETGLVPKTSEALLSGEAVYKTGKGDFLVLLDTIRQFQDFELEYEAERAQREILFAELERALGVPLEDMTCSTNN